MEYMNNELKETATDNTSNNDMLTHEMFMNTIQTGLNEIIKSEPLFENINSATKNEELKVILSLEHGESMIIFVRRGDNQLLSLIIKVNGTVKDLKLALKSHFKKARLLSPETTPNINWKYTWKNFSLVYDDTQLLDDKKALRDYGIGNKCELQFVRKVFRNKTKNQTKLN